ncbi:class IIb bacteriocin, lactobin A/cerein 7B family [Chryseobacterium nematophagum]|uniref:Class IIb bacteriocin, lactobin A/cerein 7B family n=1 Tax=Chryseobacterium nematophagum TaxID=2305228 RepID=A0A3M7L5D4_9FLAO|nr:class IIb bacteriocin, lactobin A/cerein 7B family [Chryseobacterium nematophagum]RMZ57928.1 class IIb bacteriocin, lactobin A/cerein 7B family [Chryseobacterium nematophagum]
MNLNKLNVQEMSHAEMTEVEGGILPVLILAAILAGTILVK